MKKFISFFCSLLTLVQSFGKYVHFPTAKVTPQNTPLPHTQLPETHQLPWYTKIGMAVFYFIFPKNNPDQLRWSTFFILALIMSAYFYFGLLHLGKFQTADEDLWYANPTTGRIHEYWKAIENKDWESTRINDKPGVTTAILGYLGYVKDSEPERKMLENGTFIDRYDPTRYEETTYWYQLPFIVVNGALLVLLFWLAWHYTRNDLFALLFTGFTALTPLLIGISQIVNPDATIWSFGFTALMAYLVFLKTTHFRWLLLAIPLFGLALLSKYSATFLMFFTFFLTFAHPFFQIEIFADRKKYANAIIKTLIGWVLFVAGAVALFSVLMPAALLHHEFIYKGTIGFKRSHNIDTILWSMGIFFGFFLAEAIFLRGRLFFFIFTKLRLLRQPILVLFSLLFLSLALFTLVNWGLGNHYQFKDVPFDAGVDKEFTKLNFQWKPFLEIKPLIFTSQPLVLLCAFLTLSLFVWKRNNFTFLLFAFISFLVFYYTAVLSQNVLVHGRYSVLLYPALAGLSAIGIVLVFEKNISTRWFRSIMALPLLAFVLLSVSSSAPYTFNYTNDLLPKDQDVTGAWGLGGYEAAQYINNLPDAENLIVWSDYEGVCPFLKGRCIKGSVIKWYNDGQFSGFDYLVESRRGFMQNESSWKKMRDQEKFYPEPVWELIVNGHTNNFVRVYKMKEEFNTASFNKKTIKSPINKTSTQAPKTSTKKK